MKWKFLIQNFVQSRPFSTFSPSFNCIKSMTNPNFDNLALRILPLDRGPNVTRQVRDACYALVNPTPIENPRLVLESPDALALVNLAEASICSNSINLKHLDELVNFLSGNKIWPQSEPAAHCYCGHQFGSFAGQLGDGAVIYLGEIINDSGQRWELQLKGAGLTPFSRQGDGRKVLRSSLREFLCSEAMHYLGVPTTRAASVITSDTMVQRDVFYTGDIISERATVTSRLAPTFIRFGSFEITTPLDPQTGRYGPSFGNPTIVSQLADFVIENFYPGIWLDRDQFNSTTMYLKFFEAVVQRTASLVAHWQTIGFCHGVLNTDNMSILGLTMDYGPYGFMDRFSWDHICNTSDTYGRYSYAQQPEICLWNCKCLADSLIRALVDKETPDQLKRSDYIQTLGDQFEDVLKRIYLPTFQKTYLDRMRAKLGLFSSESDDDSLVKSLLDTMEKTGADFTNTFLALEDTLAMFENDDASQLWNSTSMKFQPNLILRECCGVDELIDALEPTDLETQIQMLQQFAGVQRRISSSLDNKKVLKWEEKLSRLNNLKHMTDKEKHESDAQLWSQWLNSYWARLRVDYKLQPSITITQRLDRMHLNNPRVVPRNYLLQEVIDAAEKGDFVPAQQLFEVLKNPFNEPTLLIRNRQKRTVEQQHEVSDFEINSCSTSQTTPTFHTSARLRPPEWAKELKVT